ncbi:hypothetical protein TrVE_jg8223 [Triparma verrucosa]|uniref:Uncharacterized protein n=2 Tax=Triparma TaxID=722752 RepID=A0A9W7F1U6_9STRA|nr:hypothetical protein TrVE_jg8223 [Triparma verrucosa]GMI00024.1 hypothetical protein TrST_g12750 [Triparma strigata]
MATVEEIQRSQGEEMMAVLQIEMNMEASRQEKLSKVRDPEEYKKLESLFQIQRETSQARIEILRLKHSEVLSTKVKKLVKYKKTARLVVKPIPLIIPPGSPVEGRITPFEEATEEEKDMEVKPVDFFHTEGLNEAKANEVNNEGKVT